MRERKSTKAYLFLSPSSFLGSSIPNIILWEFDICRAGNNSGPGHFGSGQIGQRTKTTYPDPVWDLIRTSGPYPDPDVRILHPLNVFIFGSRFTFELILMNIWAVNDTKQREWTHNHTLELFTFHTSTELKYTTRELRNKVNHSAHISSSPHRPQAYSHIWNTVYYHTASQAHSHSTQHHRLTATQSVSRKLTARDQI